MADTRTIDVEGRLHGMVQRHPAVGMALGVVRGGDHEIETTGLADIPKSSAIMDLRTMAVSRLMLDNIPHIKAFWIATGIDVAQVSLWFGVDDLDGTVQEEKIYHMAGARTPEMMTTAEIQAVIRAAGREPVERDTLYNVIHN